MPTSDAVWGIDIGQCALKALRCRPHADPGKVIADAFDYIEYPQILTQPGADPAELIGAALKTFLARNKVKGDRVAISVPGQNGLARFIKLPPVESKKIPDIVRYEARQQIPFDLKDVIWDYQRMGGGSEEEGFALETEIGLFAMKRDQVHRALEPFQAAGIEADIIQLTPLALFNFLRFDFEALADLPPGEQFDAENPPPSLVILSLGTDASDLVVTNGYRVWQRSIPIGGNHFTRALMKELKLTFPKAEHLKRNATSAQDPKAVFQAMRPVFNDLLTEVQRSIGYFTSIDREAKLSGIVALGNAMKLPGLRKYLEQNLGFEVLRVESFRALVGSAVLAAPAFQQNLGCFGVCYGLAIQGLGRSGLRTNLLPRELLVERLIRAKKPWAVAVAALLLLGATISFASFARALATVDEKRLSDDGKTTFAAAERSAKDVQGKENGWKSDAEQARSQFGATDQIGQHLVGNVEGRFLWMELLRAINHCLPSDPVATDPKGEPAPQKDIDQRDRLYVTSIDCHQEENLHDWFERVHGHVSGETGQPGGAVGPGPNPNPAQPGDATGTSGPQGPGWVIELRGFHYHNNDAFPPAQRGAAYVQSTLIANLQKLKVELPAGDRDGMEMVAIKDMGISDPVLIKPGPIEN
jgi:type IV pilus assembly protein PilM